MIIGKTNYDMSYDKLHVLHTCHMTIQKKVLLFKPCFEVFWLFWLFFCPCFFSKKKKKNQLAYEVVDLSFDSWWYLSLDIAQPHMIKNNTRRRMMTHDLVILHGRMIFFNSRDIQGNGTGPFFYIYPDPHRVPTGELGRPAPGPGRGNLQAKDDRQARGR